MLVPNRHKAVDDYRYGFQGQEKDDVIRGGEGNSLNYTFRMHDPRTGRFFAVDPLAAYYPYNSPYAFSENDPVNYIELEGLEKSPTKAQVIEATKTATSLLSKFNSRLTAISARGTADAITNANTLGISDAFGGDNLEDYDSTEERRAYIAGRILGDVASIVQGGLEVDGGLGGAAVGLVGGGVGALPGLAVAGHGALVGGTAGIDLLKTSVQISSMVEPSSESSEKSSTNGNSNSSNKPQHTYKIKDKNNNVLDQGISGQPLNKNGKSPRAQQKINEKFKGQDVKQVVTRSNIREKGNQSARQIAKKKEIGDANAFNISRQREIGNSSQIFQPQKQKLPKPNRNN